MTAAQKRRAAAAPPPLAAPPTRRSWLAAACAVLAAAAAAAAARSPAAAHLEGWARGAGLLAPEGPAARARGPFPAGCRWREAANTPPHAAADFWAVRRYEFFDEAARRWGAAQPAACRLAAPPPPPGHVWANASRTSARCDPAGRYCVYENLWLNRGAWHALGDARGAGGAPPDPGRNVEVLRLDVADAGAFPGTVDARFVPGDAVMIDFLYFLHPTAIGHWPEHLGPLASALARERAMRPARVLLLHLKRAHVSEWARAALAVALGAARGEPLPPVLFQAEVPSVWAQIGAPLEGAGDNEWVCFERVLAARDSFSGGARAPFSAADARALRARAYALQGLPAPPAAPPPGAPRRRPPRAILFLRKSADRRVRNEGALLALLRRHAPVAVAEFTAATPVSEQLRAVAAAGVLVSAHTSALANAIYLRPGAAVVELIQRNWAAGALDRSFLAQTAALGDVHHFAWRARGNGSVAYLDGRDAARFGGDAWAGARCDTEECTEAHTRVDIVVDLEELGALLDAALPRVFAGEPVRDAEAEWPAVEGAEEGGGGAAAGGGAAPGPAKDGDGAPASDAE